MTEPPNPPPPPEAPRRLAWGALKLVLGLALLAFVLIRSDVRASLLRLASAPWLFPTGAALAFAGYLIEAQRLVLLLRSQEIVLTFRRALRFVLMALPVSYVVPGGVGGDLAKIAALASGRRSRVVELTAVVLVDRATGLVSLLLVALGAAGLSASFARAPAPMRAAALAAGLGLAAVAFAVLLAWSPAVRTSSLFRWVTTRAPLHALAARGLDALHAFRAHTGALAAALGITMAGHMALAGFFVLAARALLPDAPAGLVAWVSLLALVANVLPLTPGGLGVGEAAFAAAFRIMGFAGGASLLLVWRLGTVPFAALGGLLYILGFRSRPSS